MSSTLICAECGEPFRMKAQMKLPYTNHVCKLCRHKEKYLSESIVPDVVDPDILVKDTSSLMQDYNLFLSNVGKEIDSLGEIPQQSEAVPPAAPPTSRASTQVPFRNMPRIDNKRR